jgi:hypothetical protein
VSHKHCSLTEAAWTAELPREATARSNSITADVSFMVMAGVGEYDKKRTRLISIHHTSKCCESEPTWQGKRLDGALQFYPWVVGLWRHQASGSQWAAYIHSNCILWQHVYLHRALWIKQIQQDSAAYSVYLAAEESVHRWYLFHSDIFCNPEPYPLCSFWCARADIRRKCSRCYFAFLFTNIPSFFRPFSA